MIFYTQRFALKLRVLNEILSVESLPEMVEACVSLFYQKIQIYDLCKDMPYSGWPSTSSTHDNIKNVKE